MDLTPAPMPLHLGALHPYEHALVLVLAFGPLLLLGLVIAIRRRQDAAYDDERAAEVGPAVEVEPQRDR